MPPFQAIKSKAASFKATHGKRWLARAHKRLAPAVALGHSIEWVATQYVVPPYHRRMLWAQQSVAQWSRKSRQIVIVGLGLSLGFVVLRSLPYLSPIRAHHIVQDDRALVFRDRNGLSLGTLLSQTQERTLTVPLDQISEHFQYAIMAAEDRRFRQHAGLDLLAVSRASLEALQAKQIVSGASTISMQLARLLDAGQPSRHGNRVSQKLHDIWQAWRLEAGMSKPEILEAYANRLPMGGNLYGVEAAARDYFGVPAADLTLNQASLLASLPNNPVALNPYVNLSGLQQRQDYVLEQMQQQGWITAQQRQQAQHTVPSLQLASTEDLVAPHFLFWIAAQPSLTQRSYIATTLDRPLQEFVAAQVRQVVQSLAANNVNHAAALVIENQTGEVLAYVGSPDYFAVRQGGNDGVQALRQPGSALKPLLYQLALETDQLDPNSILADTPAHYAIPNAQLYSPVDYTEQFQGPVRLRYALANSLNIPAVRTLEKVTVPIFLQRLLELGFADLTRPPEHYGLGLALGSGEVSLWQLAQAYTTLARQGEWRSLRVTHDQPQESRPLLAQTETLIVNDMLRDPYARAHAFGIDSALTLPFPATVKTGTSSNYRDTWAVGFTADYTVATWVGNFSGVPMQKVSGVTGATPLWHRIMLKLHEQDPPAVFSKPTWPKRPICADTGLPPAWNCSAVVLEYLRPEQAEAAQLAIATSSQSQLAEQAASPRLEIIFPKNGDRFLVDVGSSQVQNQRIAFQIANSPEPVSWYLNGQPLAVRSQSRLFWLPEPGIWRLEVRQGQESDAVTFKVEALLDEPQLKRGFSLMDPE